MGLTSNIKDNDFVSIRQAIAKLGSSKLGPTSSPTFAGLTLTGLDASEFVFTNADNELSSVNVPLVVTYGGTGAATFTDHSILLGSGTNAFTALGAATDGQLPIGSTGADPVLAALTGTADEIDVTNAAGSITIGLINPLIVSKGGTGAATLTNHSLLVGSGTDAITALGVATNGQLPIGSTGANPVLAALTAGAGISVTNGAGSITVAVDSVLEDIDTLGPNAADSEFLVGTGVGALAWESGDTVKASLGLTIGTNVQAWDAQLDDIAALAVTDGNVIVGDGTNWIVESGDTVRTSLGLAIGTNVQAWDAQLDDIAALAVTDGNIIVGDGSNWVVESGNTARTSLGLGTNDSVEFQAVNINAGIGELTCGSINKATNTLTLEIAGTPVISILSNLIYVDEPIYARGGSVLIGVSDTTAGQLTCYGGASGAYGGKIYLNTNADIDDDIDYYYIRVEDDDLHIGDDANGDRISIIGTTGVVTLADGAVMSTSGAPTTDAMIANKKYVDDSTATPAAHTHDGDTLELDAIDSNGGVFNFTTSNYVVFNQDIHTAGNILFDADRGGLGYSDNSPMIVFDDTNNRVEFVGNIMLADSGYLGSTSATTALQILAAGDVVLTNSLYTNTGLYLLERADDVGHVATWGHIWVKNETPNQLWFTDDAGNKTRLDTEIGEDVQAYHANLQDLSGLTYVVDSYIKMVGANSFMLNTPTQMKQDMFLDNVENTTLSTWAGTASITTLGTIETGTWEATDVGIAHGGTGQSTAQAAINALTAVGAATNEHVLTKDTATGNAIWKAAAGGGGDNDKVGVDSGATAGYIGAANNDGVLRTSGGLSYTDGGDYITLGCNNPVDRGDPAAHDFDLTGFTVDGAWHDWDLSSIVPAGATWVVLYVSWSTDAGNQRIQIRKNGNSNTACLSAIRTQVANIRIDYDIWVPVDSNRVIEYNITNGTGFYGSNVATVKGWTLA